MNIAPEESTSQSDDTQGHGLTQNVNETVDSDDDTQGHGLTGNVNETVDSDDDDTQGHGLESNVNETVDSDDEAELKRPDEAIDDLEPDKHEADEVTGGSLPWMKIL